MAAWRFAHAEGAPTATGYSPILFAFQWLTFLIAGANDFAARILPALAGTALVLAPAMLRGHIGRLGALAAGVLLALSPTALILSRTASGDILVAAGAMLCAIGLSRAATSAQPENSAPAQRAVRLRSASQLVALGLALMLVSSPLAYSAILAMGGALLLLVAFDTTLIDRIRASWGIARDAPNLVSYSLGTLAVSWMVFGTSFGWHFGGLGASAALLPEWLGGFLEASDNLKPGFPALILLLYEPLILHAGAAGAILAFARLGRFNRFLALWSLSALVLAVVRTSRGPGDVLIGVLPLACLGGYALARLYESLRRDGNWFSEGFYLLVTAPIWAYLLINLTTYTDQPAKYSRIPLLFVDASVPTFLIPVLATALPLFILAVAIGFIQGPMAAFRGLALSALLALTLYTGGAAFGVSQNRADDPRELLVVRPTATDVRLLVETLSRIASERIGSAHAIDLTVRSDDPVLAWILRDFREQTNAGEAQPNAFAPAVVTPYVEGTLPLGEDYVGQVFPLRRSWEWDTQACRWYPIQVGSEQVSQLDCSALVDWIVYRKGRERSSDEQVVLWVKKELLGW
jgi:4-amino-4-deoxy-L-arabinose transferase-like glycosyltransferase